MNCLTIELPKIIFSIYTEDKDAFWTEFLSSKYRKFLKRGKTPAHLRIQLATGNLNTIHMVKNGRRTFKLICPNNKRKFKRIDFHIKMALGRYMIENNLGLLIHSCCLVRKNRAYVFSGPTGSGKSTLVMTSPQYPVLNDDFSIIYRYRKREFFVCGSPFHESHPINRIRGSFPIHALYFISKASKDTIRLLSMQQIQKALLKNMLAHRSRSRRKNTKLLQNALKICYALAEAVPGYTLGVKKGGTFWDKIDDEEGKNKL